VILEAVSCCERQRLPVYGTCANDAFAGVRSPALDLKCRGKIACGAAHQIEIAQSRSRLRMSASVLSCTQASTEVEVVRSTTFTGRVDAAAKKRLERLAKDTGRSRSFLAAEAINDYLDVNESGKLPASSERSRLSIAAKAFRTSESKIGSNPGAVAKSDRSLNADDPGLVT
jgi:predicted DNA-binding protein